MPSSRSVFGRMNSIVRPEQRLAHARFKQALLDFSDAPGPVNLMRYLNASKALDEASSPARESRPDRNHARVRRAD